MTDDDVAMQAYRKAAAERARRQPVNRCKCGFEISILNESGLCGWCAAERRKKGIA